MSDTTILQNSTHVIKPKKSVALSGVPAGNTALCTVGKSGNDLHYRGYDILDLAEHCEFEEVAHLLIHGKLPTRDELAAYKTKLKALRGLPANVRTVLEALPAASHPMDVMRTGVSALGCTLPEKEGHTVSGARDIADKLLASLSSILLYWYHYSHNGERIQPETDDDSIGGHFLHLLHGEKPSQSWEKAMHISLVLYAEHEFNASTFTSRVIAGLALICIPPLLARLAHCAGRNTAGRMKCRWRSSNATKRRAKPKPISASGWKTKKWSLVLGIRFIPSPTRVIR